MPAEILALGPSCVSPTPQLIAGLIDRLLNAANKPGEKTKSEGTPVKEVAPAK